MALQPSALTKRIASVLVLTLVFLGSACPSLFSTSSSAATSKYLISAEGFLVSQYNGKIGLVSEHSGSSTNWLYSDNYLALLAFKRANSSDPSYQLLVEKNVSSTLQRYMSHIPNAKNQYMVLTRDVSYFNNSANYRVASVDGSSINITLNNLPGKLNPHNYADIAFLEALYYKQAGNKREAIYLFKIGAKMYNGIGLNDSVYVMTHQYQTYKLALYLYVAKILGQGIPSSVKATLLSMQSQTTGGFYTGYNSSYSSSGTLENVETTSLAILALTAG
jgi:hypothetical protein